MKRIILVSGLALIVVVSLMMFTGCFTILDSTFEYGLLADDTYCIVAVKSKDVTSIDIPSMYKGKQVTRIKRNAFEGCVNLTSVTIPEGIAEIEVNAFSGCSKLETISIPNSVKVIEDDAFKGCNSLKYNTYEYGNYLGNSENPYVVLIAGLDKEATTFQINENCNVIYNYALLFFTNLTTIDLPYSITYIGFNAFGGCSSLESFVVPNMITEFDFSWFWSCSSLKTITLGANIKSVSIDSMMGCTSFEEFEVSTANSMFAARDGVLYTKDLKALLAYPIAKPVDSFSIPSYVETLTTYAFNGCIYLKSLTMWSTIKKLYSSAVINCSYLHTINFNGTMSEWITLDNANPSWDTSSVVNKVVCSDGTLTRSRA